MNSKSLSQTTETLRSYVNPNQHFDVNYVRLRHNKSSISNETPPEPAHFILSTGDFLLNEKEAAGQLSQTKHKKTQIFFIILTALSYLLYTLRLYIKENYQTTSEFWTHIKPISIPRVYTSELRPNLQIENILIQTAEICQTAWLIYILTFLVRRAHIGYLYRNPNIFNTTLCLLLLTSLSLQVISQTSYLPPEASCGCLFLSSILLILTCRAVSLKLVKYAEKYNSFDLFILRYFVLNSLFLYTTSIIYLTICSAIECFAYHLDSTKISSSLLTTICLSSTIIIILIYFLLDRFVYDNEFRSIWTPYLFLAVIFYDTSMNQYYKQDKDSNTYLYYSTFILIIFLLLVHFSRQIYLKCCQRKKQSHINSYHDKKNFKTEN